MFYDFLVSKSFRLDIDLNWTYIRRSEDVLYVFWTPYLRLIYDLCPTASAFTDFTDHKIIEKLYFFIYYTM